MGAAGVITSPDDAALAELCGALSALAEPLDASGDWPAEQLRLCGQYGVYQWFADAAWGGQAWDQQSVLRGYLALSAACLTTTFVLTQRDGACRRIESSSNEELRRRLLAGLTRGELFATVGISHLTTSRRHLTTPVLRARRAAGGFVLEGFSPWVTGADHADYVVVGATLMRGSEPTTQQLLAAVPTNLPGVRCGEPAKLVGLSASHTGPFHLDNVLVGDEWIVAGPVENVMSSGAGAGTGGLGTSTLALGLGRAALAFLAHEADQRPELAGPREALAAELAATTDDLFSAVRGQPACSTDELRQRANSLVLRATQAALGAAKGAGYVAGHPAGRWCREALFFLVWSCPQGVLAANLCELAGILE
ncbi:MAG: acyl-CoA/acyl-ACP dehydrogenase [Pirellulales bacterium]|nr:acyl-CoA/acyl-ACP dehydrogenase [Pirellulales bacterium]